MGEISLRLQSEVGSARSVEKCYLSHLCVTNGGVCVEGQSRAEPPQGRSLAVPRSLPQVMMMMPRAPGLWEECWGRGCAGGV